MPAFTVKNIPSDIYGKLKKSAQAHHRSINNEIIVCIERVLRSRRFEPDAFLSRIETLQKQVSLPPLTDKILRQAKKEGRP